MKRVNLNEIMVSNKRSIHTLQCIFSNIVEWMQYDYGPEVINGNPTTVFG